MKRYPYSLLFLSHLARRIWLKLTVPSEPDNNQSIHQLKPAFDRFYETRSDPWAYRTTAFESARRKEIISLMPDFPDTILDIGCSEGFVTDWLKAKEMMSDIYGVDISDVAIERAIAQYPLITFRSLAFGQDRLPRDFPKKFDLIVATDVLYYGTQRERTQLVTEIARLLKPDGRLIATMSPRHNQTEIQRLKKYFTVEEEHFIGHLSWISRLRPKNADTVKRKAPKTPQRISQH